MVRTFTYDAFGRLARTTSPWPHPGYTGPQMISARRYYYDGTRRISEAWIEHIFTQDESASVSNQEIQQQALQDGQSNLSGSSASSKLESLQLQALSGGNGTIGGGGGGGFPPETLLLTSNTTSRQYIWGPGDQGIDELVAQIDVAGRAIFALQDASGDPVAWADAGPVSVASPMIGVGPARIVATANFDAYGTLLSWRGLHNHAPPSAGHKGLFFERFDEGIARLHPQSPGPSGEVSTPTPQLEPNARGLYYVRNRWLDPQRGRWLTSDPNATGQVVVGLAWGGANANALLLNLSLVDLVGDGTNLYGCVQNNPINRSDPAGLESLGGLLGRMGAAGSMLRTVGNSGLGVLRRYPMITRSGTGALVQGGIGAGTGAWGEAMGNPNATPETIRRSAAAGLVGGMLSGALGGVPGARAGNLQAWSWTVGGGMVGGGAQGYITGRDDIWLDILLGGMGSAVGRGVAQGSGGVRLGNFEGNDVATEAIEAMLGPLGWGYVQAVTEPSRAFYNR